MGVPRYQTRFKTKSGNICGTHPPTLVPALLQLRLPVTLESEVRTWNHLIVLPSGSLKSNQLITPGVV